MSESEAPTGLGAGAPGPPIPVPNPPQGSPVAPGAPLLQAPPAKQDPAKRVRGPLASAKDLRAEELAGAIASARSKSTSDKQRLIDEAMEKGETAEMRRALGLDLPFDVRKLITQGIVEQRGMRVADGMYIDMHKLNKAEDIMADRLVEEVHGPMQLTKSYMEAKLLACIAMATTRVNQDLFPVPAWAMSERNTDEYKRAWELKKQLLNTLLEMDPDDTDSLALVYSNLDKMDVLVQEEARKKSG
jgi:hypothetical protein